MNIGYNRPLYLLPFDHRHSYVTGMFHVNPPLTVEATRSRRRQQAGHLRRVPPSARTQKCRSLPPPSWSTRSSALTSSAMQSGSGYVTALSTEKSGSDEFEFEYGAAFAEHIEAFGPTFAKALVRYNPEGDAALNRRQAARLKQLSDYCRSADQLFMFELLVPATKAQMDRVQADRQTFDLRVRPELMFQTIRALQDAGVEPDVWKIEGLDRREDCERVVETVRRTAGTTLAA